MSPFFLVVLLHVFSAGDRTEGFIFPGTKWCGPGNVSSGPAQLGILPWTDICCQAHDNCPEIIPAWRAKYGLVNTSPLSRLSCKCDEDFWSCLTSSRTPSAFLIQRMYFKLQSKCFKFDHPKVKCKKYVKGRCISYTLDMTQPKRYQWFDLPMNVQFSQ